MIELHLHGRLRDLLTAAFPDAPTPLQLAAATPAQAVAALMRQVPGLEAVIRAGTFRLAMCAVAADVATGATMPVAAGAAAPVTKSAEQTITADTIGLRLRAGDVLHLHPLAAGAGIETGTALLIGAIFAGGALVYALSFSPNVDQYEQRDDASNRASYLFDGGVNTQAQGGAVSLIFGGPIRVGSATVSGGITSERVR